MTEFVKITIAWDETRRMYQDERWTDTCPKCEQTVNVSVHRSYAYGGSDATYWDHTDKEGEYCKRNGPGYSRWHLFNLKVPHEVEEKLRVGHCPECK